MSHCQRSSSSTRESWIRLIHVQFHSPFKPFDAALDDLIIWQCRSLDHMQSGHGTREVWLFDEGFEDSESRSRDRRLFSGLSHEAFQVL
jgi:hypothetical protein